MVLDQQHSIYPGEGKKREQLDYIINFNLAQNESKRQNEMAGNVHTPE